jgi:hypothetical protein
MPRIEIAHDVYAALQRRAVPFEDDINDVLRRLLREGRAPFVNGPARVDEPPAPLRAVNEAATEAPAAAPAPAPAAASGLAHVNDDPGESVVVRRRTAGRDHLAQTTVRSAVLAILSSRRDAVSVTELFSAIERQLRSRMTDRDREMLPAGITQWQAQTRNALTQLQYEGHIERIGDDIYRSRAQHLTG